MATRWIPDPKIGGSIPSALRFFATSISYQMVGVKIVVTFIRELVTSCNLKVVSMGLEPMTNGLLDQRSTN